MLSLSLSLCASQVLPVILSVLNPSHQVTWEPHTTILHTILHTITVYMMAGERHIDFSSELKYCGTKQYSTDNQRDSVVSTDLSTNDEVEMTHRSSQQSHHKRERDVEILVLRDRSNLSLALRKLQCGSECLPGEVCSKCYKNQSSAISFISTSSCRARCEKCHHQVSLSQIFY